MLLYVAIVLLYFPSIRAEDATTQIPDFSQIPINVLNETRRILKGREVSPGTRPYMVYLRPVLPNDDPSITPNWLCGGVIIHEYYILTSAACIENVGQFYVISGTHTWTSDGSDECIKNGGNLAVWKCVLKYYNYDGKEFDNINWMHHDIAVVRVQDQFNFNRRVRGCDFIPAAIAYNNKTEDKEKPNTVGAVAGWGSTSRFGDPILNISAVDSPKMLEADVRIISKRACKKHWPERYGYIIDSMICTQDIMDLNAQCADKVNCKGMSEAYDQYEDSNRRHSQKNQGKVEMHTAHDHNLPSRRSKLANIGGFCENDHGGPLIVGQGMTATVVGVITACQVKDVSRKCHGPFLYTSVYQNRYLISCAIYKEYETETCRKAMRDGGVIMVRTSFITPKVGRSGKKSMAGRNDDSSSSSSGSGETQPATGKGKATTVLLKFNSTSNSTNGTSEPAVNSNLLKALGRFSKDYDKYSI